MDITSVILWWQLRTEQQSQKLIIVGQEVGKLIEFWFPQICFLGR